MQRTSLFEADRLSLDDSIAFSLESLRAYGERYPHWSVAYSGGKDSSATVTFVAWAIKSGNVPAPQSLTILYADTRMEYPPLFATAMELLAALRADGFDARVVQPALDDRFYVYMLGLGVPPPTNRFRWCTPQLKVEPMMASLADVRAASGEKLLSITGVRMGESAARDARIAVSCSRDTGECGQGWFQITPSEAVADTLAPLLHWRLCHVYDWLYFEVERHGYPQVVNIADVYGDGDVRTGCIACNLASRDEALRRLARTEKWRRLEALLELKPLYAELKMAKWRIRKGTPEVNADGHYAKNGQRMGPLTFAGRAFGLERVMDIQARAGVDLINPLEEERIRKLWSQGAWPQGWSGDEVGAAEMIDLISVVGDELIVQPVLIGKKAEVIP